MPRLRKQNCYDAEEVILLNQKQISSEKVADYLRARHAVHEGKWVKAKDVAELHDNQITPDQYLLYIQNGLNDIKSIVDANKSGYNHFNAYVKNENRKFVKKISMSKEDTSGFYDGGLNSASSASDLKARLKNIVRVLNKSSAYDVSVVEFVRRHYDDYGKYYDGMGMIGDRSDRERARHGEIFPYRVKVRVSLKPVYYQKIINLLSDIQIRKLNYNHRDLCRDTINNVFGVGKYHELDRKATSREWIVTGARIEDNDFSSEVPGFRYDGAFAVNNYHANVIHDVFSSYLRVNYKRSFYSRRTYKLKFLNEHGHEMRFSNISNVYLYVNPIGDELGIGHHSAGIVDESIPLSNQFVKPWDRFLFNAYQSPSHCSDLKGLFKTSTQRMSQVIWMTEKQANSIAEIRAKVNF